MYAFSALLSVFNTYRSIAVIVLVQLNYAICTAVSAGGVTAARNFTGFATESLTAQLAADRGRSYTGGPAKWQVSR
ncbi:MAG TPA: hypothetical protein VFN26_19625 [Candidatus Acidoferrum sp.]|nr:hypothetical protein [Candidatus Acidoferrum sp.]